jgi:hypothetical protein
VVRVSASGTRDLLVMGSIPGLGLAFFTTQSSLHYLRTRFLLAYVGIILTEKKLKFSKQLFPQFFLIKKILKLSA